MERKRILKTVNGIIRNMKTEELDLLETIILPMKYSTTYILKVFNAAEAIRDEESFGNQEGKK